MNTQLNNIDEHFIFDSISTYYEENSLFSYNGYCGEVDSCGRVLFVIKAEEIARANDNSFFVKINGKWGFIVNVLKLLLNLNMKNFAKHTIILKNVSGLN